MQAILKAVFARLQGHSKKLPAKPHFNAASDAHQLDNNIYLDIFGRVVPDAEQQFYPPKPVGLSVFQEEAILNRYQDLISQLEKAVKIGSHRKTKDGRSLFEARYIDVIYRLASYVHMLPASEYHHHSQPGGLFRHSLESALFAVQQADNYLPPTTGSVDLDEQRRRRYLYATWVGALMHDSGKLITDLRVYPHTVFDAEKNMSVSILDWNRPVSPWVPHLSTLTEWAKVNSVDRYMVHFRERTHKQHDNSSVILLPAVLQGEGLEYIMESPDNLYGLLHDALSGYTHDKDYLSNMIRYGDSLSTSNDMKYIATASFGVVKKSKMLNIVNLIRALRHEWSFNDAKAQAWVIGESVFLRWEASFHSVLKSAKEQRVDDIPQDTNTLLLMMEDHGVTRWYDKNNRSVLFAQGKFEQKDVLAIAEGKHEVQWAELIQVVAKEWVFDSDPLPGNARGVMFLQATNEFFLCFESGVVKPVDLHNPASQSSKGKAKTNIAPAKTTEQPNESSASTKKQPKKEKPKTEKNKGISFVNGPAGKKVSQPEPHGDKSALPPKDEPEKQSDTKPLKVAKKDREQAPTREVDNKVTKPAQNVTTAEPAVNTETSFDQSEIQRLVALIKNSAGAVKGAKLAIAAKVVAEKWGMDVESAGRTLHEHGLLKIRLGSNDMTFKGLDADGNETVFFALTPRFNTISSVTPNDDEIVRPKSKPKQPPAAGSKPKRSTLSQSPKSTEGSSQPSNQEDARKVTEQLQNKTLQKILNGCPDKTLGGRFKRIIKPENYSKLLQIKGETVTFDLIEIMNKQERAGGYPLRENISKVYRIIEGHPATETPESSSLFSMTIKMPTKLLAEIEV